MTNPPIAIWAINPFEEETRPGPEAIRELREWAQSQNIRLQPTHVLYVSSIDLGPDNGGTWVRRFIPAIEREMSHFIEGMDLPLLMPPKVLVQKGGFTGETVDTLIRHAQDIHADWLITSSKGRSGAQRMVLGSFAETLLARSPLPIWVFGHGDPTSFAPWRVLFATDFSAPSKAAFEEVVKQAKNVKAEVLLYHCINLPESAGAIGFDKRFPFEDFLRDQSVWAKTEAESWQAFGKERGVRVDLEIEKRAPDLAKAVIGCAQRKRAGIIALSSSSGSLGAVLLGSGARQIIRQSDVPVWAFGPSWAAAENSV